MPELRAKVSPETLARFDEAKAELVRHFGARRGTSEAVDALLFVFNAVRREGRLGSILSRYPGSVGDLESH